jgi:SAM-dependent methyltransferase
MKRLPSPELLDGDVPPHEAEASLRDIEWVHRNLGGRALVRRHLAPVLASLGAGSPTLLDVGCGSGHVAREIGRPGPAAPRVLGLDLKMSHARLSPRGLTLAGDALRLPLADGSVDVVFSTLFLHHFGPEEVRRLLAEAARVARRAVVALDLTRSVASLALVSVVGPLFFESRLSIADGRASVRQAYTLEEARSLAQAALPGASVTRAGAFVWGLVFWKEARAS